MEIQNCSFDVVPRPGAYYIDTNVWMTDVRLARFNLTCDLVANFTIIGRFNLQPSGQPLFSRLLALTFQGRWDTITDGSNCSCSCSGTMILAPSFGPPNCIDSNAVLHPDDYNFCGDLPGIQDHFIGTFFWAMDDGNLLLSRTGVMPGRAATFTTAGEFMPYTSVPGTYWGFSAAYVSKNCSLTPAPPPPGPPAPQPPSTNWTAGSIGACCSTPCSSFTGGMNVTAFCTVITYSECVAQGPAFAFRGPGTTCTDGSCSSACCCASSCTAGLTPQACSQVCNTGNWYGVGNSYTCGGSCGACPEQIFESAAAIDISHGPAVHSAIPPPSPSSGICYYGGCVVLPTAQQVCYIATEATCYGTPGYSWASGEDCYQFYTRYACLTTTESPPPGGTGAQCGQYNWPNWFNLYQFYANSAAGSGATVTAYWYGDGTNPVCLGPNTPPLGGCPNCSPYVPPPPPPTPPPSTTVISIPDFNSTGACCSIPCSDSGQQGTFGYTSCQTISYTACLQLGVSFVYRGDGTSCDDGVSCNSACCCPGLNECRNLSPTQCASLCGTNGAFAGLATSAGNPPLLCVDATTCPAGASSCVPAPPPPPSPTPPPPPPPAPTGACAVPWCAYSHLTTNCFDGYTYAQCLAVNPQVKHSYVWLGTGTTCAADTASGCCCASGYCVGSGISATSCSSTCGGSDMDPQGRWYGQGSYAICAGPTASLGCTKCQSDPVQGCGTDWQAQIVNAGFDIATCLEGIFTMDPTACVMGLVNEIQQGFGNQPVPICPNNYGFP